MCHLLLQYCLFLATTFTVNMDNIPFDLISRDRTLFRCLACRLSFPSELSLRRHRNSGYLKGTACVRLSSRSALSWQPSGSRPTGTITNLDIGGGAGPNSASISETVRISVGFEFKCTIYSKSFLSG